MKEQIKTPEKELSNKEIDNLSDVELKTLVIRMVTEPIELCCKMEEMKGYAKCNKTKYTGNQQ